MDYLELRCGVSREGGYARIEALSYELRARRQEYSTAAGYECLEEQHCPVHVVPKAGGAKEKRPSTGTLGGPLPAMILLGR